MNTETVYALFRTDGLALRRWFAKNGFGKTIVAVLFVLVFAGVAGAVWGISGAFFRYLAGNGVYGQLTAQYVFHAALLTVLWLTVASSVAVFLGSFLFPKRETAYLMTLPVGLGGIVAYESLRMVLGNLILMAFVFMPVAVSYAIAFGGMSLGYIPGAIFVLLSVDIAGTATGMLLASLGARYVGGRMHTAWTMLFFVFFAAIVGFFKAVFPASMERMATADAGTFMRLFEGLPLNNPFVPTLWLSRILTTGISWECVPVFLGIAGISVVSFRMRTVLYRTSWQDTAGSRGVVRPSRAVRFDRVPMPLAVKDLLSVVRLPSEYGYGVFLLSVAAFFFAALGISGTRFAHAEWSLRAVAFTFAWIVFFVTAAFMRFIFPLTAREGRQAWYIFALPVGWKRVFMSKTAVSLMAAVGAGIFGIAVLLVLPFTAGFRTTASGLLILTVLAISLIQVSSGAIFPNYGESGDTEKISTNGMGIVALGFSVAACAVSVALVLGYPVWLYATGLACTVVLLFLLACRGVGRGEF